MTHTDPDAYPILSAYAAERGLTLQEVFVEFSFKTPTNRHGLTRIRLYPGVIDDQAIECFAWSRCALLAGAIHEKTGWPLAAIELEPARRGESKWRWKHVGVHTPDGRFLDIYGPKVKRRDSNGQPIQQVTMQQLIDDDLMTSPWHADLDDHPAVIEIIRYFADTLIAKV